MKSNPFFRRVLMLAGCIGTQVHAQTELAFNAVIPVPNAICMVWSAPTQGVAYVLQTADLTAGPWVDIPGTTVTNGGTANYCDSTPLSRLSRFYRVRDNQTYSVNTVGYTNVVLAAGTNILTNPLNLFDNN